VKSPSLDRAIGLGYVHRDFTQAGTSVTVASFPATVAPLPFVDGQER
jgi:glycine cleavage system aminomethyltransferase T